MKPREQLPLQFHWREIAAAALLAAGVILVWARGGPFFQAAYQERAVQATIQQQVKQIETLRSQIEADPGLTPEQRQALTRPLEEALEKLRSSKSMEQAISALHEAEEQLRSLYSSEAGASALEKASGLNEAGNGLSQQDGSPLQSFGERLATGEYLEAAQKLQNIDPASLSGEEAAALAGQLEETAAALKSTDPELAQHLREAAEAIRRGDMAAAQQALQQAGQTLGQAGQQIHQAQVAGQAAAQAGQGQQRILQAGRSAQSQQPGGQGQADGQGQGSGQGSSSQPDGNAGGGAGRGEGGGNSDQGSEAGDNPIQPDNGPGDAGERPYEQIYAPERLGELNSAGSEVAVPGSSQPGDQVLGQGNTAPGSPGDSRVPYVEVLPFYEEAYRQAIESGDVPVFLRDLVRKYFSSLQP